MNIDPLATALREITATKSLLQSLLVSSESFDYPRARLMVRALEQKMRDMTKLQADLQKEHRARLAPVPNVCVLDFNQPVRTSKDVPRL